MRETEPDVPIENNSADHLQLIVPNLHRRYSGVTATNRMVAPILAKMFRAAWLGPRCARWHRAAGNRGFLQNYGCGRTPLIWHARRNNEMIAGVLARSLGWPLRLVLPRRHSGTTPGSRGG